MILSILHQIVLSIYRLSEINSLIGNLLLGRLFNRFLVLLWHLPANLRNGARCVPIVLGDLAKHFEPFWHLDVWLVLRAFNAQKWRLLVHIKQCFNHEVLTFVDEALAELFEFDETPCSLIQHLDILSRCQLALLLDAFLSHVVTHFMRVNVWVIFANLANKGLSGILSWLQECFLSLEYFLFHALWGFDVKHAR